MLVLNFISGRVFYIVLYLWPYWDCVELAWKMIPRRSVRKISDNMRGIF